MDADGDVVGDERDGGGVLDVVEMVLDLGAGALLAQNLDADESLLDTMSASYASANVLAFAAPELAESLAPSPAADQYALAAVGYFALTGLAPYPHPTLPEQLRAKRLGPPPSVAVVSPDVPPELAALLERAMSPDPVARFASLGEFEERLKAVIKDVTESDPGNIKKLYYDNENYYY